MKQILICGAAALCIFTSCRKSEEKKLIGEWKLTASTIDTNKNGSPDASERIDWTSHNIRYIFKEDDVLIWKTEYSSVMLTWDLNNDGDVLGITEPGASTEYIKVLELSDSDLKLETEDNGQKGWTELKKQ